MTVHNFTREELSLVRLALLTFRAHSEQEALTMDEWARDETFEEATRDQCRRNAEASRSFARRAGELLDAPSSPLDPTPAKPEPIRVVVALEGGLVQGAVTDRPGVSVMTIDYDVEGADADDVLAIPQDNGDTAEAIRGGVSAEFNPAWIDAAERAELADPAAAIELLRRRAVKYQESHPNLAADALAAGDVAAEEAPDWAQPGAVWFSSWGYDQTNVDFYRVVKHAGAWLTLEKIAAVEHSDDTPDNPATFTGRAVPEEPARAIGKPFRRKLAIYSSGPYVKIESYSHASPWDGTPKRTSSYA